MRQYLRLAAVLLGASALVLPAMTPANAGNGRKAAASYGKPTGKSKANVNRPKTSSSYNRPNSGGKKPNTANRKGKNNVVAGNTVVVNKPPAGGGYYDNGRYNDRPDWDDDDNDFLEFVGKTAAVTAGVSVVSAVIGSVVNDKPDGCQPVVSGGVQYQLCDGVYYQAAPQAGPSAYQVVPPPQ